MKPRHCQIDTLTNTLSAFNPLGIMITGQSSEVEHNSETEINIEEQYVTPAETIEDYHSDEDDSKHTAESMSSESSCENENGESSPPEEEENSSGDYYGEPGMTVLTPIIEMGSIDSDTASHGSDADESDSEDGDILKSPFLGKDDNLADEEDRPHNFKSEVSIQEAIERVKRNDVDLKRIELDDRGLNDFDTAELFYSLRHNTVVTHVSLANNKLGDSSAVSLAQVLIGNKSITFACLRGNNIGNQGALTLTKVLKANETLTHLDLSDNDINAHIIEGLQENLTTVPSDSCSSSKRVEQSSNAVEEESTCEHSESLSKLSEPPSDRVLDNKSVSHGGNEDLFGVGNDLMMFMETYSELSSNVSKVKVAHNSESCPSASAEVNNNGTLNSCNLIQIYDELSVCDDKQNKAAFRETFTASLKSRNKTQDEAALLLAMSLAQSSLDSKWCLESNMGSARARTPSTRNYLGERKRLPPWMKCNIANSHKSDESVMKENY